MRACSSARSRPFSCCWASPVSRWSKSSSRRSGCVAANSDLQSAHTQARAGSSPARARRGADAPGPEDGRRSASSLEGWRTTSTTCWPLSSRRSTFSSGAWQRGEANVRELVDAAIDGAQRAATLTHRAPGLRAPAAAFARAIDANKFVGGISDLLRRTLGETVRLETVLAGGLWRIHADAPQLENGNPQSRGQRARCDGRGRPADDRDRQCPPR